MMTLWPSLARRVIMAGLLTAAVLALWPDSAVAGDVYRYRDPFGNARSMVVPKGYAKYYQRAQNRAKARAAPLRIADFAPVALAMPPVAEGDPGLDLGLNLGASENARIRDLLAHPGMESYRGIISKAAADAGVDSALLGAVIAVESGFRKDARSPRGALGLMQLMPGTAASLVKQEDIEAALVDPATNVNAGSRHLRSLLDRYPGRLDLALAAYNAGPGAVAKYDDVPPYAETRQYVRDVIALYARYKNGH
ncbi:MULTISPECIES: lytic transglycosylase domain-containing protein [unclassified Achromobacter]|uniref:lytic transglycosylase domain-containing protein n=1 Tax=unclassified Achromobacter TaxID=2626865 RepID=UPI000B5153D8|nr:MULTISPECIES: lytic transglycosylase domain-containing protein [unclassified Achromobacter]OWT73417.1 lytic transglycosylase [Achromobacter sp. HZ34]OWT79666.1 lytic transglycosylase [Achromobacter sp. HZ28]